MKFCITLIVICSCNVGLVYGQSESQVKQYLAKISAADSRRDIIEAHGKFLKLFSIDQLEHLTINDNASVALAAKWEIVQRTVEMRDSDIVPPLQIDEKHLQRFMGFLEGATRTEIPKWWRESLLNLKAHNQGKYLIRNDLAPAPLSFAEYEPDPSRFDFILPLEDDLRRVALGPSIEEIVVHESSTDFKVQARELSVGEELLGESMDKSSLAIEATWSHDEACIIAFADSDFLSPYPLLCFDKDGKELRWQSEVTPIRPHFLAKTGPPAILHWFEIRITNDMICVFGGGLGNLYLECFDLDDGESCCHFSTSY